MMACLHATKARRMPGAMCSGLFCFGGVFLSRGGRGCLYFLLVGITLGVSHFYVVNETAIKRLPFKARAWIASFSVVCEGEAGGMDTFLADESLPSFSLTGRIVYIGEKGELSECGVSEYGDALEKDFRFRFASMTKAVTVFSAIDMANTGRLDLDRRMVDFFPEVDQELVRDKRVLEITLQNLLNHSSGLGGVFGSDDMVKRGHRPWCPYNLREIEKVRLVGQPGTDHLYTNVAYCLVGEVVSRVAEEPFRGYISREYLNGKPSLHFLDKGAVQGEPVYDFSNEHRIKEDYTKWLDFFALSSSAGLVGRPAELAELVWDWNSRNPGAVFRGPQIIGCDQEKEKKCYSYTFRLEPEVSGGGVYAVQEGYMPGASSLLAISRSGQVVVWVAAGAPERQEDKEAIIRKVGDIFAKNR